MKGLWKMEKQHRPKTLNVTVMVIITVIMVGTLYATSIDAMNSAHPFNGGDDTGNSNGIRRMYGGEEFVLGINVSEKTWYEADKDISSYRSSFGGAPSRTSAFDTGHPWLSVLKEHDDDFHHEINKSNQGNTNSRNRPTPHIHGEGEFAESSEMSTSSASSAYFERVELLESQTPARKGNLLLHRHKRYLLFPEGSSFQLVFDLIIPIVDYTNFAIMGITCAVAWELPSKPPSEIIENFRTKVNDGTFGLIRRNDSVHQQLQYVTGQGATNGGDNRQQGPEQLSATVATATSAQHTFITNARDPPPRNFYYSNTLDKSQLAKEPMPELPYYHQPKQSNFLGSLDKNQRKTFHAGVNGWPMHPNSNKWSSYHTKASPASPPSPSWSKENWWERNKDRIEKQWHHNQSKWQSYGSSQRTGRNRKILTKQPKHRIYPVFGKRRKRSQPTQFPHHTMASKGDGAGDYDDDLANKLHEIHTKEHLHTRHKLYGKIEKLYKTRGHNGTACVLRTLCETHKDRKRRHSHTTPRSFVMELLRAIFTLPPDTLATLKLPSTPSYIDSHYTDAVLHAHKMASCSDHYDGCEHSIWQGVEF